MSAAVPADSAVDFALSRPPPPQRGPSAAPGALRASLYASRLYRLTLLGSAPAGLAVHPPDPWPGDAATGDRLFQGRYRFAGHEVTSLARPIWLPPRIDAAWLEAMHGFDWLRHFKAAGGEAARRHARTLVADWIRHCGRWRPGVWDAAVVGRRVTAWIAAAGFLLHGADLRWRTAFFASLAVQERHLARVARREATGARRVAALSGPAPCARVPRPRQPAHPAGGRHDRARMRPADPARRRPRRPLAGASLRRVRRPRRLSRAPRRRRPDGAGAAERGRRAHGVRPPHPVPRRWRTGGVQRQRRERGSRRGGRPARGRCDGEAARQRAGHGLPAAGGGAQRADRRHRPGRRNDGRPRRNDGVRNERRPRTG